jgi:uncharacterized cupin superfamily protein
MPPEAKLTETGSGLAPEGEGWFVVNARDVRWFSTEGNGRFCTFEGDERWPTLGFGLHVLEPGQPMAMYHGEENHEVFILVAGEALLLVEGEERPLRAWDLVSCAPWTEHILVGAGEGPALFVCASPRVANTKIRYTRPEVAVRHGAAPPEETDSPAVAYANVDRPVPARYREGDLS